MKIIDTIVAVLGFVVNVVLPKGNEAEKPKENGGEKSEGNNGEKSEGMNGENQKNEGRSDNNGGGLRQSSRRRVQPRRIDEEEKMSPPMKKPKLERERSSSLSSTPSRSIRITKDKKEIEEVLFMDSDYHLSLEKRFCYVKFKNMDYQQCSFISAADVPSNLIDAAIKREEAVRRVMIGKKMDGKTKQNDFKDEYSQKLREVEREWNKRASLAGQPLLYFENWTNSRRIQDIPNVEYLAEYIYSASAEKYMKKCKKDSGRSCKCNGFCTMSCECKRDTEKQLILRNGTLNALTLRSSHSHKIHLCDSSCQCPNACRRQYEQLRRKSPLVLLYQKETDWGLFATEDIKAGAFIGSYMGKIFTEAESKKTVYAYQYTLEGDTARKKPIILDAREFGNETRYFNNGCGTRANICPITIRTPSNGGYDGVSFFAKRNILAGEELRLRYQPESQPNGVRCRCHDGCQNLI